MAPVEMAEVTGPLGLHLPCSLMYRKYSRRVGKRHFFLAFALECPYFLVVEALGL